MATLTIRMPDDKADRLKTLAEHRDVSVNKLMEELATYAIAQFDTESMFRARAARGSARHGLAMLDELDAHFARMPKQAAPAGYSLHEREVPAYDAGSDPEPKKPTRKNRRK